MVEVGEQGRDDRVPALGAAAEEVERRKEIFKKSGWQGILRKRLELRKERAKNEPVSPRDFAVLYALLGDKDQAMIWLTKAYQARFNPSILVRPAFDALRSDARFQDLLRRIGLPSGLS